MHRRYRQIVIPFVVCICMGLACADAYAAGKSFTVQLGAFSTYEAARKHHVFLNKGLPAEYTEGLTIKKTSNYYVVRFGKALTYPVAAKILKKVRPVVKDAFIMKQPVARKVRHGNKAVEDADHNEAITGKRPGRSQREAQITPAAKSGSSALPRREKASAVSSAPTEDKTSGTRAENVNLHEVDSRMASFLEEKDYHQAVEFIEKAISQSPREPALYSWYGSSLIASNRPYRALQQFRKAAELAPRKPEYQNGIGYSYVYITIDAARQSIEAFRKVLLLDPNNVDALEGLGAIYASIGDKQQAYNVYSKLAEKDKNAAKRLHTLMSNGLGLGDND